MSDFIADGQPFETPEAAADQEYARTPSTIGRSFGALFDESSITGALSRAAERGGYAGSSWFDQALAETGEANAGMVIQPAIPSPLLSAKEANERFAPEGTKITDAPMPEALARVVGQEKTDEVQREGVLSRFAQAHSWPYRFGVGTAAFMLDPANAASTFLPGVGEETVLSGLGRVGVSSGLAARTTARLIAGGTTGAIAQAPLSAARYGLGREEASDYDLREAFSDMAYAAGGGAALHAGIGGAGDFLSSRRGIGPLPSSETTGSAAEPSADSLLPLVRSLERSGDTAVSPKGAIGRYQIMPETARQYGFDPTRLNDPAYNERAARTVLGDLQQRFGSDTEAILVAYNAGPGRAERWLRAGRDDSVLPQETQNYLARGRAQADANVVQNAAAPAKMDALRSAVSQIADGRPVDVLPVFNEAAFRQAADAAALREQDAALAKQIDALPPGDAAAADRLTRIEAVEQDLQNSGTTADQRKQLGQRRDALLADTTPEALQAAAAPIAQRRVLEAQRARIADQTAMQSARAANERLSSLTPDSSGPELVAEMQRRLYSDGFAPGIAQPEFDALRARIYGAADTGAGAEGRPQVPSKSRIEDALEPGHASGTEGPVEPVKSGAVPQKGVATGGQQKPVMAGEGGQMPAEPGAEQHLAVGGEFKQPLSAADHELAELEKRFAADRSDGDRLLPEEKAEFDRTEQGLKAADLREQAYAQAAECLTEAGL